VYGRSGFLYCLSWCRDSQAQRIADVRTLWDPTYKCLPSCDTGFDPITAPEGVPKFLVRVKSIIQSTSPGLGLAVTEYNFGGTKDISGAIAQAEALGVFGKLNVTIATVFPGPSETSTVYQALKIFGKLRREGGLVRLAGGQRCEQQQVVPLLEGSHRQNA